MRQLTIGLLLLLAACDPGEVRLVAPATGGGGGRVVSIRAMIDTPYAAVAAALGWTGGVPGAEVRVHLMTEPYDSSYWHEATADSTGTAAFPGLLYGVYEAEVTRTLSDSEIARGDSTARVLAGGRRLYLPTTLTEDVTLAPDHRGSLVFSEFGFVSAPPDNPYESYADAKYFEVYNNSDTAVYLDGKYWGIGWHLNRDYPSWPCAQTGVVRNDLVGSWVSRVFRFPGRGSDYPLAPGGTALIAKAAIDHRVLDSRLPDLSQADFEWGGSQSADNPDVPNLDDIGPQGMVVNWPFPEMPQFLADPVDLASLSHYTDPSSGRVWVRIPRALVLDMSAVAQDWTTSSYTPVASCLEWTHRLFERLPGPAWAASDPVLELTEQRRILMVLPDGRKVLQDTETSMADFVKAAMTPGWIP